MAASKKNLSSGLALLATTPAAERVKGRVDRSVAIVHEVVYEARVSAGQGVT